MRHTTHPGALPAAARRAEQLERQYARAVKRAEALRRAEIIAAQDRLIAWLAPPFTRLRGTLSRRLAGAYLLLMKSGKGSGAV
jgi:hypothetical protein